jgi:hypothetical protein
LSFPVKVVKRGSSLTPFPVFPSSLEDLGAIYLQLHEVEAICLERKKNGRALKVLTERYDRRTGLVTYAQGNEETPSWAELGPRKVNRQPLVGDRKIEQRPVARKRGIAQDDKCTDCKAEPRRSLGSEILTSVKLIFQISRKQR